MFSATALDVFKHCKDAEIVFNPTHKSAERVWHSFLTCKIRNIDQSLAGDESVDRDAVHSFPLQRYVGLSLWNWLEPAGITGSWDTMKICSLKLMKELHPECFFKGNYEITCGCREIYPTAADVFKHCKDSEIVSSPARKSAEREWHSFFTCKIRNIVESVDLDAVHSFSLQDVAVDAGDFPPPQSDAGLILINALDVFNIRWGCSRLVKRQTLW